MRQKYPTMGGGPRQHGSIIAARQSYRLDRDKVGLVGSPTDTAQDSVAEVLVSQEAEHKLREP
jgi:hypothetical protein